jgi:hypothetical protein
MARGQAMNGSARWGGRSIKTLGHVPSQAGTWRRAPTGLTGSQANACRLFSA